MLFASTQLAARIERAECGLVDDCTAAIARRIGGANAFSFAIAGGIAAFSGAESPLTKVVGLGFGGMPSASELERVEFEFGAHGAPVQVELCSLAETAIGELLTRRGYALVGFEDVLGRALGAHIAPTERTHNASHAHAHTASHARARIASRERAELAVAESGDEELGTWIDVVVNGFAAPDVQGVASHESFPRAVLERIVRDTTEARGYVRYLARLGVIPAGGASMRASGGVAQLCGAATLPAHRRKGVQTALLERRLADAARAGCDIAVVTTLPGSKSHENVQRHGFELLYTRAILRRDAR